MVTDFHTHILPSLDDGSSSVEESIAMLRMEAEQGIAHIVATPHFYPHSNNPQQFIENRNRAEQLLQTATRQLDGLPKVSVGVEVYYFPGISELDVLAQFAINLGKYVLIEMPSPPWSNRMYQELADISRKQGLTPIVAHIDRYITPLQNHNIPNQLSKLPVLIQANASFFLRNTTKRMALRMLEKGQIHLLGSDCHNCATRPPNLAAAVQVIEHRLGRDAVERIQAYENRVLSSV